MKLLSAVTALNPKISSNWRGDGHGVSYLVEALNHAITESLNNQVAIIPLKDKHVEWLCETLKVLFNVTARFDASSSSMGDEEIRFQRLAIVLRDLLLCPTESPDKQFQLQSNIINVLINIPTKCFSELVVDVHPAAADDTEDAASNCIVFEYNDVTALKVLLDCLKARSDYVDVSVAMICRNKKNVLL